MQQVETDVRNHMRRLDIKVIETALPRSAVVALAPAPDRSRRFLVIDTGKDFAWAHAAAMIANNPDKFSRGTGAPTGILP